MIKLDFAHFTSPRDITLFASKLAACANMHRYCPPNDLADQLAHYIGKCPDYVSKEQQAEQSYAQLPMQCIRQLDEVRNTSYASAKESQAALKQIKETFVEKPQKIKSIQAKIKKATPEEVACVERVLAGDYTESDMPFYTVAKELKELTNATTLDQIEDNPLELPENIIDLVQRDVYTKHGTEKEDSIREKMQQLMKTQIDKNNNKFVTSSEPFIVLDDNVEIYLGGRHDGMTDDGKVVEIKTRQRRFLGTPLYELVQVHAYMFIYNTTSATIIESYNGQERSHEIEFDYELWSRIKANTTKFFEEHYLFAVK